MPPETRYAKSADGVSIAYQVGSSNATGSWARTVANDSARTPDRERALTEAPENVSRHRELPENSVDLAVDR